MFKYGRNKAGESTIVSFKDRPANLLQILCCIQILTWEQSYLPVYPSTQLWYTMLLLFQNVVSSCSRANSKILCNWPKTSPWILDISHSCFYVSLRFHLGEAIILHRVSTFLLVNGAKYPLLLLTDFNTSERSKMPCSAYIQHHVACDHWLFYWWSRSKQNKNSTGQLSSSEWWNESLGQVTDKNVRKTKVLFAEPDLTAAWFQKLIGENSRW